jgi:hypothetical protein
VERSPRAAGVGFFQLRPIAAGAVYEDESMTIGLIGRKAGMTRVFTDAGESVPVTVIEVLPNRVTQIKTPETDGYKAVQVTYGARRPQLVGKAVAGHYAKAGVAPGQALLEFRLGATEVSDLKVGSELTVEHFKAGQVVDVTGTTIILKIPTSATDLHVGASRPLVLFL